MIHDGECKLPAGYFFNNGAGYYSNNVGHYCVFMSWPQWLAAGGPRPGAPTFAPIPSSMVYDGVCHGYPIRFCLQLRENLHSELARVAVHQLRAALAEPNPVLDRLPLRRGHSSIEPGAPERGRNNVCRDPDVYHPGV